MTVAQRKRKAYSQVITNAHVAVCIGIINRLNIETTLSNCHSRRFNRESGVKTISPINALGGDAKFYVNTIMRPLINGL